MSLAVASSHAMRIEIFHFYRLLMVLLTLSTAYIHAYLNVDTLCSNEYFLSIYLLPNVPFTRVSQVINYDSRGGISIETRKGDLTTSHLLIQNADETNSGKYSCSPSNAIVASIRVHVLNGECGNSTA